MADASILKDYAFLPKLYCRDSYFNHTRSYTMGSEGFASDWRGTEFESEAVNRSSPGLSATSYWYPRRSRSATPLTVASP